MSGDNYCEKKDLPLNIKDESTLIRIVAEKVGVDEKKLRERVSKIRMSWVKNRFSYWQLNEIAEELKRNEKASLK